MRVLRAAVAVLAVPSAEAAKRLRTRELYRSSKARGPGRGGGASFSKSAARRVIAAPSERMRRELDVLQDGSYSIPIISLSHSINLDWPVSTGPVVVTVINDDKVAGLKATARLIWADASKDATFDFFGDSATCGWNADDECIQHPTLRGGSAEAYAACETSMINAFNDPRLNANVEKYLIFNTKANIPMGECAPLLVASEEIFPADPSSFSPASAALEEARGNYLNGSGGAIQKPADDGSGLVISTGPDGGSATIQSCPKDLTGVHEIDDVAVMYYALVPSSPPGTSNGILCARLEVENDGWVGFAISPGGTMEGSLGIVGLPDDGTVLKYELLGTSPRGIQEMSEQTLRDTSIVQRDGITVMTFTKLLAEPGELEIKASGENIFLHARGMTNKVGYHGPTGRMSFIKDFGFEPVSVILEPGPVILPVDEEVDTTLLDPFLGLGSISISMSMSMSMPAVEQTDSPTSSPSDASSSADTIKVTEDDTSSSLKPSNSPTSAPVASPAEPAIITPDTLAPTKSPTVPDAVAPDTLAPSTPPTPFVKPTVESPPSSAMAIGASRIVFSSIAASFVALHLL